MKIPKKKDNKKIRIREWTAYLWCIDKETLKDTKGKATCHKDQQQQNIPVRWEGERERKEHRYTLRIKWTSLATQ